MTALFWLLSVALGAQMDLHEALTRAGEASLELQIQRLSVQRTDWLADPEAGDPSVRMRLGDVGVAGAPPSVMTRLRMPLPRPWDLATALRERSASSAREQAELDRRSAQLHADVTLGFHQVLFLREAAAQAEAHSQLRTEHLGLVESRRIQGLSSALDWLESEEARRDADDARAGVVHRLHAAEAGLRQLCGLPEQVPLELVPDDVLAHIQTHPPSVQGHGAAEELPSVHEATARVARERARLTRARLQGLPWIDWVEGGMETQPGAGSQSPPAFHVGASVDIPLYQWSRHRTRPDVIRLESAQIELEHTQRQAEARIVRRTRELEAAQRRNAVAEGHRQALQNASAPMLAMADPLLAVELRARTTRAALREALATVALVEAFDKLQSAAGTRGI
jgi:hypothetical protein